jgi:hypothetical protein
LIDRAGSTIQGRVVTRALFVPILRENALHRVNRTGAISGKALYDGVVSLADLLAAARD